MKHELQVFESPFLADEFIGLHSCSACWGALRKVQSGGAGEKKSFAVFCERCQGDTKGYVTKKYIARRIERNRAEAAEARCALRPFVAWMKSNKSQEELIESLGF